MTSIISRLSSTKKKLMVFSALNCTGIIITIQLNKS